jgi:hypothetical protein
VGAEAVRRQEHPLQELGGVAVEGKFRPPVELGGAEGEERLSVASAIASVKAAPGSRTTSAVGEKKANMAGPTK